MRNKGVMTQRFVMFLASYSLAFTLNSEHDYIAVPTFTDIRRGMVFLARTLRIVFGGVKTEKVRSCLIFIRRKLSQVLDQQRKSGDASWLPEELVSMMTAAAK